VLFKGRCVKPHETCAVHVFIKDELVCVGHILPVRVMLAILAQLMWEIAFFILGAKVQANASAVRKQSVIWEGLSRRSSRFDMEDAHLQALIGKILPRFLISWYHDCWLITIRFTLSAFFRSGGLNSGI
jgi:hypothetical protein